MQSLEKYKTNQLEYIVKNFSDNIEYRFTTRYNGTFKIYKIDNNKVFFKHSDSRSNEWIISTRNISFFNNKDILTMDDIKKELLMRLLEMKR